MKQFKYFLITGFTLLSFSFTLPSGWFKAGSEPAKYEMGIDSASGKDGSNAATIKSIAKEIKGFGTLMQNAVPGEYLGKRIRMSGKMKSKDVENWAGFWLRVDAAHSRKSLAFDNMSSRSVKGTTDWASYSIVLNVADTASNLAYGALLAGKGQIWFDDIKFEIVNDSVPVTDMYDRSAPKNLNFDSPSGK